MKSKIEKYIIKINNERRNQMSRLNINSNSVYDQKRSSHKKVKTCLTGYFKGIKGLY